MAADALSISLTFFVISTVGHFTVCVADSRQIVGSIFEAFWL